MLGSADTKEWVLVQNSGNKSRVEPEKPHLDFPALYQIYQTTGTLLDGGIAPVVTAYPRMMRSKPASSMQKTYDECYLMCSTAVYFEDQNNEPEALRSWRSALDAICYHNAHRVPTNYAPKNETERALQESLRDLELQCKERVELLEALRESRKDAPTDYGGEEGAPATPRGIPGQTGSGSPQAGWIGDGTVQSLSYPEISKPPALPPRPAAQSRSSLDSVNQPSKDRENTGRRSSFSSPFGKPSKSSSSPEKRKTLLTTLRGNDSKSSSSSKKGSESPRRISRPAASKAAGLAWNVISQPPTPATESTGSVTPRPRTSGDMARNHSSNEEIPKTGRQPPSQHSPEHALGENLRKLHSSEHPKSNLAADAAAAATNRPADGESPDHSPPLSRTVKDREPHQVQSARPIPRSKPRVEYPTYRTEFPDSRRVVNQSPSSTHNNATPRTQAKASSTDKVARRSRMVGRNQAAPASSPRTGNSAAQGNAPTSTGSDDEDVSRPVKPSPDAQHEKASAGADSKATPSSSDRFSSEEDDSCEDSAENNRNVQHIMKNLPKGVDVASARQILNEIVVRGDEVHWDDVAGLEAAKKALKEAVVYPFLRPDLFMGLREPARGMLLFGPPGTGKTMLARAVATESKSTFFSVSASTLTSKWHGESEKLVRALFALAKTMAPSIIFVDEIDSLLSARSTAGEGEASRRSKTEFLIQWSDLQRAAAGREQSDKEKREGDPTRVLVLAATNMPWDIDEAARRRFVRRQYIPLPEDEVRKLQFQKLLSHQKQELTDEDIDALVKVTDGFSGSDITSLAKDAAMGPLRNLGEALLHTPMDQISPIRFSDFEASLGSIRPSVSREGLKEYEEWAKEFGERGG